MKKGLSFIVFLLLAIHAIGQVNTTERVSYNHAADYELGGITVSSNSEKIDKSYVQFISGLVIGNRINIPGPDFSNAIKKLWDEKVFSNVKITLTNVVDGKAYIDIFVEERPRLSKFTFRGVTKGQADNVRDVIKLFRGEVVTDHLLVSTVNKIKDYYSDKGYLASKVDIEQIIDTSSSTPGVILKININRGEKVKIRSIEVEGTNLLDEYQVKRAMKNTREMSNITFPEDIKAIFTQPRKVAESIKRDDERYDFYPLMLKYFRTKFRINIFKASKYVEGDYESDKDAIVKLYNKNGFRDARIVDDSVIFKGSDLFIKIKLEEGQKFFIRNVSWVGNTKYKTEELQKIVNLNRGDVYNQEKIDQVISFNPNGMDISTLYQDNGYLFFSVTPVETAVEGDSIDLEFRIYEGKQARNNRISIVGNTKTSDHVILREIRTKPGELFSRSDVIRTQQELGALGYFNPQAMNVIPKPNPQDGTVDLEYVVQEQPNDQVELSGGWGNRTLVGTLGVTFNNFSTRNIFKKSAWKPLPAGDGQRLSIRASSNGQWFQSYNFSFTEPWLGGKKPISFSVSAFHSVNSASFTGTTSTTGGSRIMSTSVSLSIGRRLKWPDDFFNFFSTLRYERYDLKNYAIIPGFNNGISHKVSLMLSLSRNSTSDPIFPTRGSDITFSVELTPPYSMFQNRDFASETNVEKFKLLEYHKWKFSSKFYTGIGGNKSSQKVVLYNRVDFGVLSYYNVQLGLSPFERFQVGGDGLSAIGFQNQFLGREIIALRGYQNGALTPNYGTESGPTGGTVYTKMTTELRFLISGNPSAKIFALIFAEAGNSWETFREFSPFRVNRSVGAGVRIFLPMFGLMGVDYGYGFDPVRNTSEQNRQKGVFHFMIGQQF